MNANGAFFVRCPSCGRELLPFENGQSVVTRTCCGRVRLLHAINPDTCRTFYGDARRRELAKQRHQSQA